MTRPIRLVPCWQCDVRVHPDDVVKARIAGRLRDLCQSCGALEDYEDGPWDPIDTADEATV